MSEWIEHDGMGYPVPIGTTVFVKRACGDESQFVILGRSPDVGYRFENGVMVWCSWHWGKLHNYSHFLNGWDNRIVAYRIVDDGAEAETKRREARINTFRKMVDGVSPSSPDPKLPAPKKRERVL